ncbi:unnamed protein product [Caenorhabditis auriculariae]|uniref:Acyl-coenzyme A oxidase n=1 Tax=Caenorhabditis auriculariae TaxID=2777116 RepID=A0A8S1GPH8_9PELO|nr:unnamed protein product [Caenorhabditis auriculariae]
MGNLNKEIRDGDHPDITEERLKSTFDTHKMAAQIYNSQRAADRRNEITSAVLKIPELQDIKPLPFLSREEKVEEAARKIGILSEHLYDLVNVNDGAELYHLNNVVIGGEGNPLALHGVMFIPVLQAQATDEQKKKWLYRAMKREIIGTYAQTEMGHGSNLRKLETTATYDKATEEFVLNSPTTTSMKWWPGNLGKSTNYAVVVATLIINEKDYGPHSFMVQLRDENTHKPLPNIEVGDIGPKMAYNATDNGFLKLNHLRIPRTNMLMKHVKVEKDGTYIKPPHAKMSYSAMVHVRAHMNNTMAYFLASSLTIAVRYSSIRRQGHINPKEPEVKVLEYQTQQHRLFPHIARAYAFSFAGAETVRLYEKVKKDMESGETELMADLHALTSGLKSVVTYLTMQGIEQARQSCGGHGYSMASYISEIYGIAIGGCTYEGENMVMLLQLARYLMKAAKAVKEGKKVEGLVGYLSAPDNRHSLIDRTPEKSYDTYLKTFEHIARQQIFRAFDKLEKMLTSGLPHSEAWNKCSVELTRASRLHTRLFIAQAFARRVHDVVDFHIKEALDDLLHLHLNYELLDVASYALEDGHLCGEQMNFIRSELYRSLGKIRPNAVSYVDAWELSDMELRSVLGRRDGHVYENLYKWAQNSSLNRTDVLPVFEKYLKPLMMSARKNSKL